MLKKKSLKEQIPISTIQQQSITYLQYSNKKETSPSPERGSNFPRHAFLFHTRASLISLHRKPECPAISLKDMVEKVAKGARTGIECLGFSTFLEDERRVSALGWNTGHPVDAGAHPGSGLTLSFPLSLGSPLS